MVEGYDQEYGTIDPQNPYFGNTEDVNRQTAVSAPTFDQINQDYMSYLGRPASEDEYNQYWAQRYDYDPGMIANSAEGLAYANKLYGPQPTPTPADTSDPTAGGSTTTTTPTSTTSTPSSPTITWGGPQPVISGGGRLFAQAGPAFRDQASALLQFMLGRANGTIKDSSIPNLQVNADDPIIRSQVDAYNAAQTRQGRRYLKELAERSGPNSNIGAEGRMVAEKIGQSTSQFQAQLMGQELNSRRNEIVSALQGAAGFLTAQEQMSLQEELADIDNALKVASLAQNESQFARNLGQRAYEFDNDLAFRYSPMYGG